MTDKDVCAQIAIETSSEIETLVNIDDIIVKQHQLLCLLDEDKFLNDDVISAYIRCIRNQANMRSGSDGKIYFKDHFISGLLKRDGKLGIDQNDDIDINFITKRARNYLKHDMIFIPINIKDSHWYLAIVNAQKHEIQVLNSLCWKFNREDLITTLKGLQYHFSILERQKDLIGHKWKDLNITTWTIKEQLPEKMQEDGTSCDLFMLKYMEYWTGDTLSHHITQEDVTLFRFKLAGKFICWKTNAVKITSKSIQDDDAGCSSNDKSLSDKTKYESLMSVISMMGMHELISGLCSYIKSIDCQETLKKIWVRNNRPYSISLSLHKLQQILKEDQPMDRDCFNLAVRKFVYEDIQMVKKTKGTISKHYLDMQFWMTTNFGQHPNFHQKVDTDGLAKSVCSWPGIDYNISKCKSISSLPFARQHHDFSILTISFHRL